MFLFSQIGIGELWQDAGVGENNASREIRGMAHNSRTSWGAAVGMWKRNQRSSGVVRPFFISPRFLGFCFDLERSTGFGQSQQENLLAITSKAVFHIPYCDTIHG